MTPEDQGRFDIREMRNTAEAGVRKARAALVLAQAAVKAVQVQCTHPAKYEVSHMGERSDYCPDCEWEG